MCWGRKSKREARAPQRGTQERGPGGARENHRGRAKVRNQGSRRGRRESLRDPQTAAKAAPWAQPQYRRFREGPARGGARAPRAAGGAPSARARPERSVSGWRALRV